MGKVIVVTSGKGGVGKTTSTAALGAALAQNGDKVVVVDFDVGLRNLDLVMGAERRVVYDLVNVIQGEAKLTQALIRDKRLETLFLLPASQTRDKDVPEANGKPAVKPHAAVHGLDVPTGDSVVEVRIRFDGATMIDVEFDDRAYQGSHYGHLYRAQVRPGGVTHIDERDGGMTPMLTDFGIARLADSPGLTRTH